MYISHFNVQYVAQRRAYKELDYSIYRLSLVLGKWYSFLTSLLKQTAL